MRVALIAALFMLNACAGQKLALAPPPGVDFSGHWKLNEAESDDAQHLMQANDAKAAKGGDSASGGQSGRQGGRGRSGGAGGGAGGPGGGLAGGPSGPAMPAMGAIGEGLRWPGKDLVIKQVAGVVAFTSDGINRVCQPSTGGDAHRRHRGADDRDALPAGRDAPPPTCGWDEKLLLVRGGDPDDDRPPFEEQYSISEDGQRLVEIVGFKGGRSNGFTLSRVWDKIQP